MCQKKEVTICCTTQDSDSKGFDIYINGTKINDDLKFYDTHFQYKWVCLPGKYCLKVVQKHFLNSRLWFFNPVLSILGMILTGYEENSKNGPSFVIEEGELIIKDNAVLEIKLKKSKVLFKLLFDSIINFDIFIEPQSNCLYNSMKKEIITTSKLRRRFIISILFPISIFFLFIASLFIVSGIKYILRGTLIGGTLVALVGVFIIILYIMVAKNVFKVAFGKKVYIKN